MIHPLFQNHLHEVGLLVHSIRSGSYAGIFLLSIIVAYIIPLPEAIVLVLFGYVAKTANLNLTYVLLISAAGGIIGDNIMYRLGFFGNKYIEKFNLKMRKSKLIQYEYLVANNIGKTIYFLRFIAGVRFFGPLISGTLGIRWKKFFLFNSSATFIHNALFILIGYFYYRRILVTLTEVEIVKEILLFSSAFIVGILISIFARKNREKHDMS
jgi:membrane protein DedA with SNARE-associated domain